MQDFSRRFRTSRLLVALTCLVGVVAAIGFWTLRSRRSRTPQIAGVSSNAATDGDGSGEPSWHTTRRWVGEDDLMGSHVCAECHSEIADVYQATHSMARATSRVGEELPVENFDRTEFAAFGRRYRVERTETGLQHHELMLDQKNEVIYDQNEPITLIIGSGRRGRGYLIQRDGQLFQSPISWYSQKQSWALSPGYQGPDHPRFDRKISFECLYCHAGRVTASDPSVHRFEPPTIVEGGISCERCHGPGREHVQRQRAASAASPDPSIVNPSRLEPEPRDSVCYQCHLRADQVFTLAGRDPTQFKPGERYDQTWVALVAGGEDPERAHSVVQQFRSSACFRGSAGRLGCISCHDPHARPSAELRDDFYRQRCLKCHDDRGCALPEELRNAEPARGSCIQCHMPRFDLATIPHTALVDHRMLRDPNAVTLLDAPSDPEKLPVFAESTTQLSEEEVQRARALVLATLASGRNDVKLAQRALDLLPLESGRVTIPDQYADDLRVLQRFGAVIAMLGDRATADRCWQRSLELQPGNEAVLKSLTLFALRLFHDQDVALRYSQQLVEANPYLSEHHALRAEALHAAGRLGEAVQSAERAIQLDPTSIEIRRWLAEAYGQLGQEENQRSHQAIIQRMQRTPGRG